MAIKNFSNLERIEIETRLDALEKAFKELIQELQSQNLIVKRNKEGKIKNASIC